MTEFIKLACEIANNSVKIDGEPFGAVITDSNDNIISTGTNQILENSDPTAHAEIIAIRLACKRMNKVKLSDCKIYCNCEPCPMCLSAIYTSGIKSIYFIDNFSKLKNIGLINNYQYIDDITIKMNKMYLDNNIDNAIDLWINKKTNKMETES